MSAAYVQDYKTAIAAATWSYPFTSATTNGNLVVVFAKIAYGPGGAVFTGCSDDAGNTYHEAGSSVTDLSGETVGQIWYAYNIAGAATHTVTVTASAATILDVNIVEFSGFGTFDPLDQTDSNAAAALTGAYDFTCGSVTPRTDGALVVMCCPTRINMTPDDHNGEWIWGSYLAAFAMTTRYAVQTTATAEDGAISFTAAGTGATGLLAVFLTVPYVPWVDIPDFEVQDVDFGLYPGGAARVVCSLFSRVSSISLQARLYDITNAASLGQSAAVYGTDDTDATFGVTSSGVRRCKLQMTADTPLTDIFCAPGARVGP